MIMRPPQHGHGGRWSIGAAAALVVSSRTVSGSGAASSCPGAGDVRLACGAREEPVVADAVEALGQDVEQEAADELVRRERHGLVAIAPFEPIVLPCEGDAVVVGRDQAAVGDRDAVGVAREIGEHRLRSGEGSFGVDEPLRRPERREAGGEGSGVGETSVLAEEPSACRPHGPRRASPASACGRASRARAPAGRSPACSATQLGAVERDPATGHDHVDVRMMGHGRAPGVEHGGDADPGAEMLRIGGDRQQRLGRCLEQQVIDHRLVLVSDVGDRGRQGEDEMEVGHGQEIGFVAPPASPLRRLPDTSGSGGCGRSCRRSGCGRSPHSA